MKSCIKILLIFCGTCAVILGFIGIFLPVLPTTPFWLLASVCYARSSNTFHHWLLTNRYCGEYIRNYREGRGMKFSQKLLTILLLCFTISGSICIVNKLWLQIGLFLIAVCVTIHLLMIKTFVVDKASATKAIENQSITTGLPSPVMQKKC